MVSISGWLIIKTCDACFAFADGSNSFLTVSSHNGGIDVYVGDGGSAQLHSEGGKQCEERNHSINQLSFPVIILSSCLT